MGATEGSRASLKVIDSVTVPGRSDSSMKTSSNEIAVMVGLTVSIALVSVPVAVLPASSDVVI